VGGMKYVRTVLLVGICIVGLYFFLTLQNIFASFGALMIAAFAGSLATKHQISSIIDSKIQ
jgi:hypothetical protein